MRAWAEFREAWGYVIWIREYGIRSFLPSGSERLGLINICFYTAFMGYTDRGVSDKEDFLKMTFAARMTCMFMFSNRRVLRLRLRLRLSKYIPSSSSSSSSLAVVRVRVHSSI